MVSFFIEWFYNSSLFNIFCSFVKKIYNEKIEMLFFKINCKYQFKRINQPNQNVFCSYLS